MIYRIAHVSDIHVWNFPLNPLEWRGKRLLGLANLALRRARKFDRAALPKLLEAIENDSPNHLVISGDITTTSLPEEFACFHKVFSSWMNDPERATVIAGNHDRYTKKSMRNPEAYFPRVIAPADGARLKQLSEGLFLAAFDPCGPNPISAKGHVHPQALAALSESLKSALSAGGMRALLFVCHYPAEVPLRHEARQKGHQLVGASRLLEALSVVPCPVYWLHGHIHHPWIFSSPCLGNVTYLNPGSPLLKRRMGYSLGRWILDWDGSRLEMNWKSLESSQAMLEDYLDRKGEQDVYHPRRCE